MPNTFVCFSYNSPPQNDPEAFCTARFLSALAADKSNKVHWVTMDHDHQIENDVVSQLISENISVTRIRSIPKPGRLGVLKSQLQHQYFGEKSWEIKQITEELRKVLELYNQPILITRALPALSNIIGFYSRRYVKHWIAHFSDPFPGFDSYSGRTYYKKPFDNMWVRRIFKNATALTVTCQRAKEYFVAKYGKVSENKLSVVTHIGFPPLKPNIINLNWNDSDFNFIHVGNLTDKRYAKEIVQEFNVALEDASNVRFVQFGLVDNRAAKLLEKDAHWMRVESNTLTSPSDASYILENASVNVVIDTHEEFPFSPYLPSKFAYAVAAGKPILALGRKDSEMADLAKKYPTIYFADITVKGDVSKIIREIIKNRGQLQTPSADLRNKFAPAQVIADFNSVMY